VLGVVALSLGGASTAAAASLGTYSTVADQVAVAGISSGGFMAVQLHVAYSGTFRAGAAVFAGGPFYCAQGSISNALTACTQALPSAPDVSAAESTTDAYANSGDIDPTSNLADEPVWLWSGTQDTTVKPAVMNALQSYYAHYVTQATVTYEHTTAAGHSWVSPDATASCSTQASPYLNNCNVDPEQAFLTEFFGTLAARNNGAATGTMLSFDQNEFFDDHNASAHSLDATGYLYVPATCAAGDACKLMVALHGCQQSHSDVGDAFIQKSGLNEWADTNHLLVLYPQTHSSSNNSSACWDWWGYDDANYAKKSGRQMLAIKRMVDRITGAAASSTSSSASSTSSGTTSAGTTATSSASTTSSSGGTTGGACQTWMSSNYDHVQAGRAYQGTGGSSACAAFHACAVGSDDDMGLNNTFTYTTLVESPAGYFAIGTTCPAGTSSSSSSSSSSSTAGTSSASSSSSTAGTTATSSSSSATASSGSTASTGAGTTGGPTTSSTGSSGAGGTTGTTAGAGTTGSTGSSSGTTSGGCGASGGEALWSLLVAAAALRRRGG
jgi:poly(3-hydroxybutyrate) depolymerase